MGIPSFVSIPSCLGKVLPYYNVSFGYSPKCSMTVHFYVLRDKFMMETVMIANKYS